MPQVPADFHNRVESRIKLMSIVSMLLMTIIFVISFGFVASVVAFEFTFADKPEVVNSLRDAAWNTTQAIVSSEHNMRSMLGKEEHSDLLKQSTIINSLDASTRAIDYLATKVEELVRVAAARDESIVGEFLTSKRLLLAFAGLFLAVVVKLLIELYKYNAHLRSHYVAVADALRLSGEGFSTHEFDRLVGVLSPPHIRIGPVRSLHEAAISKASGTGKTDS